MRRLITLALALLVLSGCTFQAWTTTERGVYPATVVHPTDTSPRFQCRPSYNVREAYHGHARRRPGRYCSRAHEPRRPQRRRERYTRERRMY